jgi:PHD/YefM family antitoxin component YafN of YafNO toxin-antitoxin module
MWTAMQNTSDSLFKTISAAEASGTLAELLEQVSSGIGRVEIVGPDENCSCVLLSKAELDCLERALAILSGTHDAEEMRAQLNAIALAAGAGAGVSVPLCR